MEDQRSGNGNNNNANVNPNPNLNRNNNDEVSQLGRTLLDYLQPTRSTVLHIWLCPTTLRYLEIKLGVIQLLPKFYGLDLESVYFLLKEFNEVWATLHFNNVGEDIVKLKSFPFSLKENGESIVSIL